MTEAEWNRVFATMDAERARLGLPRSVAEAHHAQRADWSRPWTTRLRAEGRLRFVALSTGGSEPPKPWTNEIRLRAEAAQR